jgi:hypothetical protein
MAISRSVGVVDDGGHRAARVAGSVWEEGPEFGSAARFEG